MSILGDVAASLAVAAEMRSVLDLLDAIREEPPQEQLARVRRHAEDRLAAVEAGEE